ncbi:BTB/POZ domain-containing protein At5g47800 isoform X2 [Magnolia sinica]|uniref:BTB/POZ domain-containing protein At5g47800 isoform X2 n=1 Tax=Magnolia sinica TaxID=86752 RepID=UPI00265A2C97|nr:BTB/POZ domain-containing protein At5g47800 isoform X2 [Magnolia sinica]
MKYMKLGTRPDTFFTQEATRSVSSDVPSDLTIQINNTTYLLHKCGLLQRLCSDGGDSDNCTIELHEIPGGEEAFELCAKFSYGIMINLSAHNFVAAICAAKFLRMTESIEKGNFILKLEAFFDSCILQGWKDSIMALQTTGKLPEWSENIGILGRCVDAIVEKILTPLSKVTWSYTYTRPGYAEKRHRSVPKDWWTEDISDLDIDLFRCVITAVKSAKKLPPPLIGEALHVYASRWLPNASKGWAPESSLTQNEETAMKHRRVLESIVSMIPSDRGSVSGGFVLRLLKVANLVGASPSTKAELVRRSGRQLDEVTVSDILLPSYLSSNKSFYDVDLVGSILENFLVHFHRRGPPDNNKSMQSMFQVGRLIDSYLQVVARDANVPASKIIALAEALPEFARPKHDDLYKAIDIYLKDHPDLIKSEKKRLCRILDCQKLSPDICMHAVKNERLPLRTVVQVLFLEQERATRPSSRNPPHDHAMSGVLLSAGGHGEIEESIEEATVPGPNRRDPKKTKKPDTKTPEQARPNGSKRTVGRKHVMEMDKGREIIEEGGLDGNLGPKKMEIKGRSTVGRGPKAGHKYD